MRDAGRATQTESAATIALAAAAGFGLGVLAGLVAGEWLGRVDAGRVRGAVRRLQARPAPGDRAAVERAVAEALAAHPATRHLDIRVRVLGEGLLELVGQVPSAPAREQAARLAQQAVPPCTVINRLLVEGEDLPATSG